MNKDEMEIILKTSEIGIKNTGIISMLVERILKLEEKIKDLEERI